MMLLSQGHAVMFPGKVEHGGHPITKGTRYIIVLFMGYAANRMTGREDGYVLERYRALRGGGEEAAASRLGASKIAAGKEEL